MRIVTAKDIKPIDDIAMINAYMAIGEALWMCQSFEDGLCHFISLVLKLPPSKAKEEVYNVLESTRQKTLGQLIAELRRANSTNAVMEFEQRINRFLDNRNWLVHSSWRDYFLKLYDKKILLSFLDRLTSISEEATELRGYFGQFLRSWVLSTGINPEKLEIEKQNFLKQYGLI